MVTNSSLKLGITRNDTDEIVGFYLPEEDRTTHVYVLGSSGVGKSKGLATWILGDIMNGNGCGVIDSPSWQSRILRAVNRDDGVRILRKIVLTLLTRESHPLTHGL